MNWQYPSVWFLLLLIPVVYIAWCILFRRDTAAVTYSDTSIASKIGGGLKSRLQWLPPVLKILALVVLVVALARPQKGNEKTRIFAEGIAIEMVIDCSGSMHAMDFKLEGKPVNRLTAVKDVAEKFVKGDEKLGLLGREHDMIGLISFGMYADNVCPLTLDHAYLEKKISELNLEDQEKSSMTAIGDALGLAVERLDTLTSAKKSDGSDKIKSKVVILLTDGENNAGDIDPMTAAELASTEGIRIYTIGVGTTGMAPFPVTDPFGRTFYKNQMVRMDAKTLKAIAKASGGKYFNATNTKSLEDIYAEIDKLEKTRIDHRRYAQYKELAVKPVTVMGWRIPPLILLAFVLLAIEAILSNTWLRKIP